MKSYEEELKQIKEFLLANPRGLTVSEISKKLNINRNSVAKYLDVLTISGNVEMKSVGPAKVYFKSHRVPLSAMLNFSSDYVVVLDSGFNITQANDNILNLMNVKKEFFVGKNIKECPDEVFTNQKMISKLKGALGGKDYSTEINIRKHKKEFYFKLKLIPTTFEDGELGVTIILEDTSKRKKAEEALLESEEKVRNILNSSPNAITVTDLKGNIIECNQATLDMHGFSSKEELIGKNAFELIAQRDHEKATENLKKTLKQGLVKNIEYTFLKKNGEEFTAELSASAIKKLSGEPLSFVAITKEIAGERKAKIK